VFVLILLKQYAFIYKNLNKGRNSQLCSICNDALIPDPDSYQDRIEYVIHQKTPSFNSSAPAKLYQSIQSKT